jgi:putative ABC transport system permease protein
MARMSLSDILFLYRARLRARAVLVQEAFAVLGIAVGVALLFASQVASTSLTRSVAQMTRQVVGDTQFQFYARGPRGVDERVVKEAQGVPGVRVALALVEQPANLIGPRGQRSIELIGADPRFAHFAGRMLRRFSAKQLAAEQAIALPGPLAREIGAEGPLETLKLQLGARTVPTILGTIVSEVDVGELAHSPLAIGPIRYVQRITGLEGRVSRVFIQTQKGREAQARALLGPLAERANLNFAPADFDSRLFAVASAPASNSETLFSGISALVGFMFALNAMLVAVPSRRSLIEDIRPQGATRLMTLQILLFDAVVLGVLACALGLLLGELLSLSVFHATPGYLSFAFPVGNDRVVTWQSVALATGAGLAAAMVGVLWPLRHVLVRPLRVEKGSEREPRGWTAARLTVGVACLVAAALIPLAHTQVVILANAALVVALVCLLPILFDGLVTLFERAQRPFNRASPVIAVIELRTLQTRVRSLAIAATAAVAVFGTVEFQGIQSNLTSGLDGSARGIDSNADVWVTPKGASNAFATTAFHTRPSHTLTRLPGVDALGLYRGGFLNWGERRLWVLAPSSDVRSILASQVVSGGTALTAARISRGGWVAVSQVLASEHHLHIGTRFTLPAPRPTSFRIAALITNLGWPPGAIVMNAGDYARAWANGDPSAYEIKTSPGTPVAAVRTRLQRALGPDTGLAVETSTEREQRHYALAAQGLSRLTEIRLLVLIAAVLAVVGAMGSMIWQRRDLVAFMKVDGYRKGVLWRWLLCESAILLTAGCSIGAVMGVYGQLLGSHFLSSVTGFPVIFNVEVLVALSSFALVSLVAIAVAALPGYLVVRVPAKTVSPAY